MRQRLPCREFASQQKVSLRCIQAAIETVVSPLPNPTNAVGGSFIFSLQRTPAHVRVPNPTNAVGGSFIFSLQRAAAHVPSRIPPTQLVDRSYSAYRERRRTSVPNPTNAVGGSFIFSLQRTPAHVRVPESHQRSWWIVHIQPTDSPAHVRVPNPTNAVGGSFIFSLQRTRRTSRPESHQRSWWIVHIQPTENPAHVPFPNPTNAVGGVSGGRQLRSRLSMKAPPTALVGFASEYPCSRLLRNILWFRFHPVLPTPDIDNKRDRELVNRFHLGLDDFPGALDFVFRHFQQQLVVHLKDHSRAEFFAAQSLVHLDHRDLHQVGGGALNRSVDGFTFGSRTQVVIAIVDVGDRANAAEDRSAPLRSCELARASLPCSAARPCKSCSSLQSSSSLPRESAPCAARARTGRSRTGSRS